MTESYTNPKNDRRSLTHTGTEVGEDNLERSQNAAGREDDVLKWTCPRKYEKMTYSAGDHLTKFYPRSRENTSGDGTETTFDVDMNIAPPNGETIVDQMEYQPVVAIDNTTGEQLEVEAYDFDANTVTFTEAPADGDANVIMWPFMTEGQIKFMGEDQFGNVVASLDTWGIPLHVFNDFEQVRGETKIHLTGAASWEESETLAVYIDSEHQITWEDDEYPEGRFASTMEQRVDVDV